MKLRTGEYRQQAGQEMVEAVVAIAASNSCRLQYYSIITRCMIRAYNLQRSTSHPHLFLNTFQSTHRSVRCPLLYLCINRSMSGLKCI